MGEKDEGQSKQELKRREQEEADTFFLQSLGDAQVNDVDWQVLADVARRRMRKALQDWAKRVADEFWVTHWKHRLGDGVPKEFGEYSVRVLMREWTVYIHWYRLEVKGKKGKHQRRAVSLPPPGKGYRMNRSQFGQAKDWEIEAIVKAEDEFAKIRKCAERLENIRLEVSGFRQMMLGEKDPGLRLQGEIPPEEEIEGLDA